MAPIEYDKRDESKGPETYGSQSLLDTIFQATELENFQGNAVVIDLMSGPGGIALSLQKKAPQHSYAVLDNNQGQLDKIGKQEPVAKIFADVKDLSAVVQSESVDTITVRYGIKDIPEDQQPQVLRSVNHVLKPGGVFVLTDMISPEGMEEWTNMQHSKKQQLGGRIIQEEGECHIPTEQGWLKLLKEAGFQTEVFGYYTSPVSPKVWATGNQLGDPVTEPEEVARKTVIMNEILLAASGEVKKQFNIREENGEVKIDFPVVIIRAVKPEIKGLLTSGVIYATK